MFRFGFFVLLGGFNENSFQILKLIYFDPSLKLIIDIIDIMLCEHG